MWTLRSNLAAGALLALVSSGLPSPAADGSTIVAEICARNETLRHYTFTMNVAMVMRHFPWLHFSMGGVGRYDRKSGRYVVHFTSTPWFASKVHDIDLSMTDPSLWAKKYRYHVLGVEAGDTVYALQSLDGNQVKSAAVGVNPELGVQWTDVTYKDGTHVYLKIGSKDIDGYMLPSAANAKVDYGKMPLTAQANFSDYRISN
jgi:hypothetical protein